jgi:hypothetical protein
VQGSFTSATGNQLIQERLFALEHGASAGPATRTRRDALLSEAASAHVAAKLKQCAIETEKALRSPPEDSASNYPLREVVKSVVQAIAAVGLKPLPPIKAVTAASSDSETGETGEVAEGEEHKGATPASQAQKPLRDVYEALEDASSFFVQRISVGAPDRSSTITDERTERIRSRVLEASRETEKLNKKLENEREKRRKELSDIDSLISKTRAEIERLTKEENDGVTAIEKVTDEAVTTLVRNHETKDHSLKGQLGKARMDLAKMEEANETAFLQLSKRRLNAKSELAKVISEYDEGMLMLTNSIDKLHREMEVDKGPLETLERYFSLVDLDRRLAKEERDREENAREKARKEKEARESAALFKINRFMSKKLKEQADAKKAAKAGAKGKGKGGKKAAAAGGSPDKKAKKK